MIIIGETKRGEGLFYNPPKKENNLSLNEINNKLIQYTADEIRKEVLNRYVNNKSDNVVEYLEELE